MSLTCIIKVGPKGSEIKFSNTKMLRAISNNDVDKLIAENSVNFIVFEETCDLDYIDKLVSGGKLKEESVYLFRCGVSSEKYQVYSDLKLMQRDISFKYGTNIRTYVVGVQQEIEEHNEDIRKKEEEAARAKAEEESNDIDSLFEDNNSSESEAEEVKELSTLKEIKGSVSLMKEASSDELAKGELEVALNAGIDNSERLEEQKAKEQKEQREKREITSKVITADIEEYVYKDESEESKEKDEGIASSEEVERLLNELESKEKRLSISESRIERLTGIRDSLQDRLGLYESLIVKLESTSDVTDVQERDSAETTAKLNEYKLHIRQLENKTVELQRQLGKIDELNEKIDSKDREIDSLKEDLRQARTDDKYKEIQNRLGHEVSAREQLISLMGNLLDEYNNSVEKVKSLQSDVQSLSETNLQLTRQVGTMEQNLADAKADFDIKTRSAGEQNRQLRLTMDDLQRTLRSRSNELELALKEKDEALNAKTATSIELESLKGTVVDLRSQLKTSQRDLESSENENADLRQKLKEYDKVNIKELQENVKISEQGVSQTLIELGRAKQEMQALRFQLKQRDDTISRIEDEKNKLEIKSKSLSRTTASAQRFNFDVQYTGRASIIAVFGTGSSGVTTTAVSIAKKLPGNVLLLDFDCINPKIDAWVGMNPSIAELKPDLTGADACAFSALINKGIDYVIDRRLEICRKVASRGSGSGLYYFSGIYTPIDLSQFIGIDFNQFLNFFGNEYNYIVVDLGHLGTNENQGALIRLFNNISWRNVLVCPHNKSDVRSAYIKSKAEGIKYTKTIWLLNFAKNTKMDPSMMKILNSMEYKIMERDFDYFGELEPYSNWNKYNRSKLEELVSDLTC